MVSERILIVDDDRVTAHTLSRWLDREGYTNESAPDGQSALDQVRAYDWDLVFLDYVLPDINGLELLAKLKTHSEHLPVIFMTAHGSVELAVQAMKAGATDYITKPLNREALLMRAEKVFQDNAMRGQLAAMRSTLKHEVGHSKVVASSPAMKSVMERIEAVSHSDSATVLLLGESGVGKNLIAQEIHDRSARINKPFMSVLCTALPTNLLESELFGHERGAFTDAKTSRKGLVELAEGGTVFLDEVGELPLELQAKLLQFLEDRGYRRVGGTSQRSVDVRVIAATNRNLAEAVRVGRFRADLYYRLNVIEIVLPPLRERREDISILAQRFITMLNPKQGKQVKGLTPDATRVLRQFSWPGNVRELRNLLERAMILTKNEYLTLEDFPGLGELKGPQSEVGQDPAELPADQLNLEQHEKSLICRALTLAEGNQSHAARLLGITRNTLLYRLKKHDFADFTFVSKARVRVEAIKRALSQEG